MPHALKEVYPKLGCGMACGAYLTSAERLGQVVLTFFLAHTSLRAAKAPLATGRPLH